jgi:hypothetical protein
MTKRAQARSLLERLRRMPDATPAELLAVSGIRATDTDLGS